MTYNWSVPTGNIITGSTYIKDTDNKIQDTIDDLADFVNSSGAYTGQGLLFDYVNKASNQTITGVKTFSNGLIGNVTGNVTGTVSGNSGTATKLETARTISLSGNATGSVSFDGSANVSINATVNYATSSGTATNATNASNADKLINKNWYWSGQGGQPTWLWGGSDGSNMYIYNPSNFNVNYANSAGTANSSNYANSAGTANSATSITYWATAWGNAQLPTGEIGTYAFLYFVGSLNPSNNVAGSSLFYADTDSHFATSAAGTWKCMGRISSNGSTVFLRIA